MPIKLLTLCKYPGCGSRLDSPGYCDSHRKKSPAATALRRLCDRVPDANKHFYHSREWTTASVRHRIIEPLCRECRDYGIIRLGTLTHHSPDLSELLADGRSPVDDRYLITLCLACHNRHLRAKRK
jgi:5-methylcytosine-specific restriction protein A